MKKHTIITVGILGGLVLGFIVGEIVYQASFDPQTQTSSPPTALLDTFHFIGDTFFIGLLKMILIPLVASSVVVGVASIDPAHLGKIGGLTILYYGATMVAAVVLGVVLVTGIRPGDPMRDGTGIGAAIISQGEQAYEATSPSTRQRVEDKAKAGKKGVPGALWESFKSIAAQLVPKNVFAAAANGDILPVISFSLLFGIVLSVIGPPGQPVLALFNGVFQAVMKLVDWVLWLAPVGVFFLVAWSVARIGSASLVGPLGTYMVVVFAGLAVHGLVTLPLVLWVFGRANPYRFLIQMREALLTAFGTDSSSATLPVTIESAERFGGVSKRAAGFVLPLGATVNMDGTALYEAVAVVFLFQCYGIDLSMVELVIIVVTATLAAVGAAGIPSAGLVTMVIVVEAVNRSLGAGVEPLPLAAVGIILGVDRILDMCRTTVNVWGDAVGAKIITRIAPDPG